MKRLREKRNRPKNCYRKKKNKSAPYRSSLYRKVKQLEEVLQNEKEDDNSQGEKAKNRRAQRSDTAASAISQLL